MSQDRIEKVATLPVPRARAWSAIGDSANFGTWFGMQLDGPFLAGKQIVGRIRPTQVDAEVARMQAPYEGKRIEFDVVAVEPDRRLALRWHPHAIDPAVDYSREPTTLVEFLLEDAPGGTLLTIRESGFDQIPAARREQAYHANSGGWDHQARLIARYLAQRQD